MVWIWDKIRGIGGNRDEQTNKDAGGIEEEQLAETGYGMPGGFAMGEAAEVARDDLDELKPPRDPAP
jgi:hypothetical protein